MAKFIELTQAAPGVGPMMLNVDYIIKVEPSPHADGGSDIIVKDGRTSCDAESGCCSYTVSFRVKEEYRKIKGMLL